MTAKTEPKPAARPLPAELIDLAFLDIHDVCGALRMSVSWWYDEVRAGRAPQPLRYGARCTRWRASDIRKYMIDRAAQPQAEDAAKVTARATKASAAAKAKRAAAIATATQ